MGKKQQTKKKVKAPDWHEEYLNLETKVVQANTSLKFLYTALYHHEHMSFEEEDINGLCFLLGMVTEDIDKALNGHKEGRAC